MFWPIPNGAEIMTGDSTMRTQERVPGLHLFRWVSPAERICLSLYRSYGVFL